MTGGEFYIAAQVRITQRFDDDTENRTCSYALILICWPISNSFRATFEIGVTRGESRARNARRGLDWFILVCSSLSKATVTPTTIVVARSGKDVSLL